MVVSVLVAGCMTQTQAPIAAGPTSRSELVLVAPTEEMTAAAGCEELGAVMGRSFEAVVEGWAEGGFFPDLVVGYVGDSAAPMGDEILVLSELPPFPLRGYDPDKLATAHFATTRILVAANGWECDPGAVSDAFFGALDPGFVEERWPELEVAYGATKLPRLREVFTELLEATAGADPRPSEPRR